MFRVSRSLLVRGLVLLVVVFFFVYNTFNLLCSSTRARRGPTVCVFFVSLRFCVCVCCQAARECRSLFAPLCRYYRCRRGMSDSRILALSYYYSFFDIYFQFVRSLVFAALALWRLASGGRGAAARLALLCAALIFTGRGHYQLIDYFDCCYLIPHTVL